MDQMMTIKERIEVLVRRKNIVIAFLILGTLVGIYIAWTTPKAYRSTTLIMVEHQQMPQSYVMPTDVTPVEKRLSAISQQIMSRTRLEKIIQDFNLYSKEAGLIWITSTQGIVNVFRSKNADSKPSKEWQVNKMREDIELKVIGESGHKKGGDAFSISYSAEDPNTAMQVANTIASLFIQENTKIREQYAEDTTELLTTELEGAKRELEDQDRTIKSFKDMYMGRLPEQMDANLKAMDRLQMELTSVQASIKSAEERKDLLEEQYANGQGNTISDKSFVGSNPLEIELEKLNKELASLLSLYKENYPDVAITRGRIREVKRLLAESRTASDSIEKAGDENKVSEYRAPIARIKSQIAVLRQQETSIKEQIDSFQRRVESSPAVEQMMANMMRDYEASQKNYQALLEKKMNAKLAENMEKGKNRDLFRVIDPANLPEKAYKPKKLNIALTGLASGGGLGIVVAFMIEFMNPVFRKPEDFVGVINKPVFASIPAFSRKQIAGRETKQSLTRG